MSKIVYNKVIYDVLSKLIDFTASKDNLKKSTDDVLRIIFNIRDEVNNEGK